MWSMIKNLYMVRQQNNSTLILKFGYQCIPEDQQEQMASEALVMLSLLHLAEEETEQKHLNLAKRKIIWTTTDILKGL